MTEKEKLIRVLHQFEYAGLVERDLEKILDCIATDIIGIGIGEQGFVTSQEEVRQVFMSGLREDDKATYAVWFGRVEALLHTDTVGTVCAEVNVSCKDPDTQMVSESRFLQLLTLLKENDQWRICALHASTPVVTEEIIEAYPLKFAEKTLQGLKDRIGERVFVAEEQYRKAILADTIGFYIVNYTTDTFEKCECNSDLCARVEEGARYEAYVNAVSPQYLMEEDRQMFCDKFSLECVREAYRNGEKEISYEYRLKLSNGGFIWVETVVRLIRDVETGEMKGIMYVRNIDESKREELSLLNQATCDGMTTLYNKVALTQKVEALLASDMDFFGGYFIMLDVDNFKKINDTYGHPAGDQVLIAVAQSLKEAFDTTNLLGRLGGDEFGVFVPVAHDLLWLEESLQVFSERISQIQVMGMTNVIISCSIGVAKCEQGSVFLDIYAQADKALYLSKKSGKNQISFYWMQEK